MYKILGFAAILGIAFYPVLSNIELKDVSYSSVEYSDVSALKTFDFSTAAGSLILGGNNLLEDNVRSSLVDIDSNSITSNSSGYKVNLSSLSDSLLIVAWDSNKVVDSPMAKVVLISTDGEHYETYKFDAMFNSKGSSIGLLKLKEYRFQESDTMYVSLPLLQDSLNLKNITKAGWWIVGATPSAGVEADYALSFTLKDTSKYSVGFESGVDYTAYDVKRIPSSGFIANDKKNSATSKTGSYHYTLVNAENDKSAILYLSEVVKAEKELPSLSLSLEEDESNFSYNTVLLNVSIPSSLANEKLFIVLEEKDFYIQNSMSIPYGKEMSGPLSDKSSDDIFEYIPESGTMRWTLNAGLEQLNAASNTQFRFLANQRTDSSNIVATIYDSSNTILENSNSLPKPKNILDDKAVYSFYEYVNSTSGKLSIFIYSDNIASEKTEIMLDLETHISITREELSKRDCSVNENYYIACEVEIVNGVGYLGLDLMHRLDPKTFGVGELQVPPGMSDPNGSNNVYTIILK